jgi:uncharacterized protein (DUF924 family)
MDAADAVHRAEDVLNFWFPGNAFWESRDAFAAWMHHRMQGGVDQRICRDFAGITTAAARGVLDHWQETPRGRLALLIALDQFPRSLWRGTPGAYAQDCKAARLALAGIGNGHFSAVRPWERIFYVIALAHCEGPDHLARFDVIDRITEEIIAELPPAIEYMAERLRAQNARVRGV